MITAMTYEEFRRQIGKAGLSVRSFADLVKQTPISITNYAAKGEVPSNLAIIAALMGDMAEAGIDFRATLSKIEYEPAKPRGNPVKGVFGGVKKEDI